MNELEFVDALVSWVDEPERTFEAIIAVGLDPEFETADYPYDDRVFYYVENWQAYEQLFDRANGEDFFLQPHSY